MTTDAPPQGTTGQPAQTQQPAPQQPADPGQQQQPQTLWPHTIGEPEPPAPAPELSDEQKRLQQLEQELAEQRQQWNQREQHYQSTLEALMAQRYPAQGYQQGPAQGQQPAQPQTPQFSLDDLPDPIQSPTEFKTKLAEKIGTTLQSQSQSQAQVYEQMARGQALDSVWNRFTTQHAELAKHDLLVNGASQQLMSDLRARGIDPVALAMQNPDSLVGALAERVQAGLAQFSGQQPGQQPGPGQPPQQLGPAQQGQQPAPQQHQPGAPRTQGFATGSTATGAPQQPQQPPSFTEQLKKAQQDMGVL